MGSEFAFVVCANDGNESCAKREMRESGAMQ